MNDREFIPRYRTLNDELAMYNAAGAGNIPKMEKLISKKINPLNNMINPVYAAVENDKMESLLWLIEHGANIHSENDKALRIACEHNNFEMVKYLIDNNCDVNSQNGIPLIITVRKGYIDIAKYLIEHGANVNCRNNLAYGIASKKKDTIFIELLRPYVDMESYKSSFKTTRKNKNKKSKFLNSKWYE